MKNKFKGLLVYLTLIALLFSGCSQGISTYSDNTEVTQAVTKSNSETKSDSKKPKKKSGKNTSSKKNKSSKRTTKSSKSSFSYKSVPKYKDKPYVAINNNEPFFKKNELKGKSFEKYSKLDYLGRCGVAEASIGTDLMPSEKRGSISQVKPTGWHSVRYNFVDGKSLYNRCHLIGYQLSGENANERNLITGTRYLNVDGMLPFENMVADYVKETNNHVMYRVSPIFEGNNLLVSGVQIEAKSVEDNGEGILFNVYCYNVQPNIEINYATGDSSLIAATMTEQSNTSVSNNKNSTSNESINTDVNTIANSANDSNVISKSDNSSGSEDIGSENINSDNAASSSSANNDNTSNDTGGGGSSSILVWKSATGDKYHSINNCGRMNPAKATQITEEQAIKQGLGKCSKCW